MRGGIRESVLVATAALALTVFSTWPLAARFATAGRIDSGDGRFSVWNIAWVAHALTTDPASLYHANIFHPHRYALAFSEPNILAGVIAVPMWWVTENPMATSNWVTTWAFLLSALSTFWLVRHLTGSRAAGGLSAIFFSVSPYVLSHMPHVQLLMTFGMPLSLLAMHCFVEGASVRRALGLGLALACAGLACGYYGIFSALAVGWGLLWFGVSRGLWRRPSYAALGVLAAAVTALLVGPFLAPFSIIEREGFQRTVQDARLFSATWRDYFASPMLLDRWMLPFLGTWREVLFPGFVSTALSIFVVWRLRQQRRVGGLIGGVRTDVVWFYATFAAWAFWASFGPDGGLELLMRHTLPFFSLIRATSRFGVLVTLAIAVLAGIGLAELSASAGTRRRWVVSLLLILAVARSTAGPLNLFDRPAPSVVLQRLAAMPRGPVAEFPYFTAPHDRHRHTEYMLASTSHWKPLVNGYSDHIPAGAFAEMPALASFPSETAWEVLRRHEVRYIVMHWNMYPPGETVHERIREQVGRRLRLVVDVDGVSLFEVVRTGS
jgi:hypothetical protein